MDGDVLIAWGLPSLGLVAWIVVVALLVPRVLRRVMSPGRLFALATLAAMAGFVAIGLWLFAVAVPMPPEARAFVIDELEPWFWGTIGLIVFIGVGTYLLRRSLTFLTQRSLRTQSSIDDVMIASVRRPAHVLILFLGVVLWVEIVPAPAAITTRMGIVGEVALLVVVTLFVDSLVDQIVTRRRATSRVFATAGAVLRAMARVVLFVVATLMALGTLGIEVTPIVASLGVGSLAIGLALQSTLEDFIAGLLIAADQPVTVGDLVDIDQRGLSGTVDTIGWRTTRIITLERTKVIVPNSALSKLVIINRSRPSPIVRFQAAVGVHYDSDLSHVARVVFEVASDIQAHHEHATRDFAPVVTFVSFSASSVDLKVWLEANDWIVHFLVHDAFIRALHARFRAEGIVIPYPITTIDLPPGVRDALVQRRDG